MHIINLTKVRSHIYKNAALAAVSLAYLLTAPTLHAEEENDRKNTIPYIIQSGDTLIALNAKYIRPEISFRLIQKYNGISNTKHLRVGSTLFLPRQYLKFKLSNAEILSLRGDIRITDKETGQVTRYKVGDTISEGAVINTGRSSFMSLALEDGSQVSLPSNSNVTLRRMRRYVLEQAIDYDFDISKGGSRTKVAPLRGSNDRFQVRTPKAVSAVRGTEFQMRVDGDSKNAIAEVVEGSLNVTNSITNTDGLLPNGNGLAVTKTGGEIKEKLLPAPQLINPTKIQNSELLSFEIKPQNGAAKYRVSFASDASFVSLFEDKITDANIITLPSIDDGRYYLRASAISHNGIEGLYETYSFKRSLSSVDAMHEPSEIGFSFKWAAQGEGTKSYHFQLFKANVDGTPLDNNAVVDEAGLNENNISISALPSGDYVWRLGTTLFTNGEVDTLWTNYQKISVGTE